MHKNLKSKKTVFTTHNVIIEVERLRERTKHLDIFLFTAHHSVVSISDVLFTGGRGVSDFSVLKYY